LRAVIVAVTTVPPLSSVTVPSIRPLPNPDCATAGTAINAIVSMLHATNNANFTSQPKPIRNCLGISALSLLAFILMRIPRLAECVTKVVYSRGSAVVSAANSQRILRN
jgi:hypothetical protein